MMFSPLIGSFSFLFLLVARSAADHDSGCPGYGCLPSGTFALSSDIPVTGNQLTVGVKWTTPIVGNSGQVNRLGCVTSQNGIVCSTYSGFVSVDQSTGDEEWNFNNMTLPSLPIMNIYGEIIGTDGRLLVEILKEGGVQSKTEIADPMFPAYSVLLSNNGLLLLASHNSCCIITFDTQLTPDASGCFIGEVDNVHGSFIPVTQPVMFGNRAYILTQFLPDSPHLRSNERLGYRRLYAVDVRLVMIGRLVIVWTQDFKPKTCGPLDHIQTWELKQSSVLVDNDMVYVSLPAPRASCHPAGLPSSQDGTLWAIRDNGTAPEVVFKVPAPGSQLSLYNVNFGEQRQSWNQTFGFPFRHFNKTSAKKSTASPAPVLWAATSHQITGYNSRNGSVLYVFNVSHMLNLTCNITSKVMVAINNDGSEERLVFGVSVLSKLDTEESMVKTPYVVAASFHVATQSMTILWKVEGESGMEIVGQIPNVIVVPLNTKSKFRVVGNTYNDHSKDNSRVFLVATAVNDTTQYSFAIGN